ncbi:hypothetical protein GMMP15_320003 [Candidatus Magnetomoraceae bacterium gMMP-15]
MEPESRKYFIQACELADVIDGKQDIYQGVIFPLFKMKTIEEIKFYSTSVLWGHKTFQEDFLINVAYHEISEALKIAPKRVDIISSTPDINKLYNNYGKILTSSMKTIEAILPIGNQQNTIKFGKFNPKAHSMLIKLYNTDEFYEIYFFNSPRKDFIIQFDGRIYVNKLSRRQYEYRNKLFNKDHSKAMPFKEIIKQLKAGESIQYII